VEFYRVIWVYGNVSTEMLSMLSRDNVNIDPAYTDFFIFGRLNNSPPQFGHLNSNESEHSGQQVHSLLQMYVKPTKLFFN
jgi:nitrate reductase assembly molybdenum cofactor insertion protein NarJ